MTATIDFITALCLTVGCFLGITGASSVTDSACAFLILFALMLQSGFTLATVKLCFIFFFLVLSSTTATHALAKTARSRGLEPLLGREDKR